MIDTIFINNVSTQHLQYNLTGIVCLKLLVYVLQGKIFWLKFAWNGIQTFIADVSVKQPFSRQFAITVCYQFAEELLYSILEIKGTIVPFLSRLCFAQLIFLEVLHWD